MDLVRRIPLSAGALSLFAGLGGSRLIMGIGGSVALAGLILFLAGRPGILDQVSYPSLTLGASFGSLGWGFHVASTGAVVTIVSSLLGSALRGSTLASKDSLRSAGKAIWTASPGSRLSGRIDPPSWLERHQRIDMPALSGRRSS